MKVHRGLVFLLACAALAQASVLHEEVLQCNPSSPHLFKFLGHNIVNLVEGTVSTFENWCFQENKVWITWKSATQLEVTIESSHKRSLLCSDSYFVTSLLDSKLETRFFPGKSTQVFNLAHPEDATYIKANGLTVVPLCDHLRNIIPDVLDTVVMFADKFGNLFPKWFLDLNRRKMYTRLEKLTGVQSYKRDVKIPTTLDWIYKNVRSGDVFCEYGGDETAVLIVFGTGGVCNHVGMFLWDDQNNLWMVESNPPVVRKTLAKDRLPPVFTSKGDNMNILMLSDKSRAKFDVQKAWASFNKYDGVIYGWDNIVFSFWDTPESSFTQLANAEILLTVVAFLQKIPPASQFATQIINEGLNHRLGTSGLNFEQLVGVMGDRKIAIHDLGTIPEDPSWTYGPDQGSRYICSALVTRLLLDAGVFGGLTVLPHEHTPNDVYNLGIYKTSGLPVECTINDPRLPYCLISGERALLPFKYYNSIKPYNHMNEQCPSIAPDYFRPANC